jgi:hypothetical protein
MNRLIRWAIGALVANWLRKRMGRSVRLPRR